MSRSGYSDDLDALDLGRWRAQVASAIRGKRGQALLGELAKEMDAMPDKRLIKGDLVSPEGDCCTMGVVFKARGIDATKVDEHCPEEVAGCLNIARQLAAEIAYQNDEGTYKETPEERWIRMRKWVGEQLGQPSAAAAPA